MITKVDGKTVFNLNIAHCCHKSSIIIVKTNLTIFCHNMLKYAAMNWIQR